MAAIIFDFDGTIADSFDYVAGFLAAEAGISPLDDERKQQLRGRSMVAMARQLGHPWWRLPVLFFRGRRVMGKAIKDVLPFSGMPEVIRKLHAEGHELFVLSSNNVRTVKKFLHGQKMHNYFLEIYGSVSMFGKAPMLRRLIKEHGLTMEQAVYVGDELRDVEAAQSIGLRVVAVTWGFARSSDLEAKSPTAVTRAPADLMRILEDI